MAQAAAFRRSAVAPLASTATLDSGSYGVTGRDTFISAGDDLKAALLMHADIMRDPTTIPTVVSTGGATYDAYRALPGRAAFLDAHPSGYSYGPIDPHPQESNIDVTVTGPGTTSDLQSACDTQASDAVIGIDGTFTGSNGDYLLAQTGQTLVGVGTTAVLDNIGVRFAAGIYNLTAQNVTHDPEGSASHGVLGSSAGGIINHCAILNCDEHGYVVANSSILEYCVASGNGRYGLNGTQDTGFASDSIVRYNKITLNNADGYDDTFAAGGMKIVRADRVTLHDSWHVDNRGNGIWFDHENQDTIVEWNLSEDNDESGVFYEFNQIGTAVSEVRYNICLNNRWGMQYSDSDVFGHHNYLAGNETDLFPKQTFRPGYQITVLKEEDSIIEHNTAAPGSNDIEGRPIALWQHDDAPGGLYESFAVARLETHLPTGTESTSWYFQRKSGQPNENFTATQWDALGYETSPDRSFDL